MPDANELIRSGIDDTTRYLIFPVTIYVIQQAFTAFFKLRSVLRERAVVVSALIDEIISIHEANTGQETAFADALSTGLFAQRIAESTDYYPYIAIADGKNIIFDHNVDKLPYFLGADAFKSVVSFYDTYALLIACLDGMDTPAFKTLSAERKLNALRGISETFQELSDKVGTVTELLKAEKHRLTHRSVLWHVTGLSITERRTVKPSAAAAASSIPPKRHD